MVRLRGGGWRWLLKAAWDWQQVTQVKQADGYQFKGMSVAETLGESCSLAAAVWISSLIW